MRYNRILDLLLLKIKLVEGNDRLSEKLTTVRVGQEKQGTSYIANRIQL